MKSQMCRMIYFGTLSTKTLLGHLSHIFETEDIAHIHAFVNELQRLGLHTGDGNPQDISLRSINLFIRRYLVEEHPLRVAINGIETWKTELSAISKSPVSSPDDQQK